MRKDGKSPNAPTRLRKKFMLKPHIIVRLRVRARRAQMSQNEFLQMCLYLALQEFARHNLYAQALIQEHQEYLEHLRRTYARDWF